MSDKYSYAKKVKILAPIAWIHHLFAGVFASEYSFKDKVEFLTKGQLKLLIEISYLIGWSYDS